MKSKLLALSILMLSSAVTHAATSSSSTIQVPNAEDLILIGKGPWVIASSMAGGGQETGKLVAINSRSGAVHTLYPAGRQTTSGKLDGCPGPEASFMPHGIALQTGGRDGDTLYVVNHGSRESIEIFKVKHATAGPELSWSGCLIMPQGAISNAVVTTSDGVFATARWEDSKSTSLPGAVVVWRAASGWTTVPGSTIVTPSGIIASADGHRLYVSSWLDNKIVEFTLGVNGSTRRELPMPFKPDNLQWSSHGTLVVTGHIPSIEVVHACSGSSQDQCSTVPSVIAEIDPRTLTMTCSMPAGIDSATIAVEVGKERWIGVFRGRSILRSPKQSC